MHCLNLDQATIQEPFISGIIMCMDVYSLTSKYIYIYIMDLMFNSHEWFQVDSSVIQPTAGYLVLLS